MSLFNLDRFRFEKKRKNVEQEPLPPVPQIQAVNSAAAGSGAGDDQSEATDSSRPDTPASDVTEITVGPGFAKS